jgi:hypothetical protein
MCSNQSVTCILNYSLRPRLCDVDTSMVHYVASDLLSLASLVNLFYSTHRTCVERGGAFANCVTTNLNCISSCPTTNVERPLLARHCSSSIVSVGRRRCHGLLQHVSSPAIQMDVTHCVRGGSAFVAFRHDNAVKTDNSPVDFRPWHRNIHLIFPCSTTHLEI